MSNPRTINSANVDQFGFKSVIDIANKKIIFDITGLTIFKAGGAVAVQGIDFEVEDPSGVTISVADFASIDIDPNILQTFELPLPSGVAIFGWYNIRGVLKEADGTTFEIILPAIEVKEPKGFEDICIKGSFKETVDCHTPFIRLNETTVFAYAGKSPAIKTTNGSLYYPQGTINPVVFTQTPFQNNQVYSGRYRVRNRTIADYDLGNFIFVRIAYDSDYSFDVTCQSNLCDVACCIEEVQEQARKFAGTEKGNAAQEKLTLIAVPVMIALSRETCGKDASVQVKEIRDILGCDCGCDGVKEIEPGLVQAGNGNAINVTGGNATTVTPSQQGSTSIFNVKTKFVQVVKKVNNDAAIVITRVEDANNIIYQFELNYDQLTNTILNTIKNSQTYINTLNSILISSGVDSSLVGLDGKCVIDLSKNQYTLVHETAVGVNKKITAIVIDGADIAAPANLLVTDEVGIQGWLTGLNLGMYAVQVQNIAGATQLNISSQNNPFVVGVMKFDVGGVVSSVQFGRINKTLKNILQAVIDFLCAISFSSLKLGVEGMRTCWIDDDGAAKQTTYGAGYNAGLFMKAFSDRFCELVSKVSKIVAIDCATIRKAFPKRTDSILATDIVLGTKGGVCAEMNIKELAAAIYSITKDNQSLLSQFCSIDCSAVAACPAVNGVTYNTSIE
jgi:hypothetical protein